MNKLHSVALLVSSYCLLGSLAIHAESATTIQQSVIVGKSLNHQAPTRFLGQESRTFKLDLPSMEINLDSPMPGVHTTGRVYTLPSPVLSTQLDWQVVNEGYVARVQVFSQQAKRLRLHLNLNQDIPSIKLQQQGNGDDALSTVIEYSDMHDNEIWLPIAQGNRVDLEIFVAANVAKEAQFSLDAVNVITEAGESGGLQFKNKGQVREKEFDLACAIRDPNYANLQKAALATARIDYIANGLSRWCTGTLLNDTRNSNLPWFATANHCLNDQKAANSASFQWFYQATACGGAVTDSRNTQTFGGAKLLWNDSYLDAALLKLNQPAPNGAYFIGWDPNYNLQKQDDVWGVHHPEGDHTMVSFGQVAAVKKQVRDTTQNLHLVNTVKFILGGVESGSSGSGLFSVNQGTLYWQGTLFGGPANDYQIALYSDFKSYYSKISPWLSSVLIPEIEQFYQQYSGYFGVKSGSLFNCGEGYSCQKFLSGKQIAMYNSNNALYWWDGRQWQFYK